MGEDARNHGGDGYCGGGATCYPYYCNATQGPFNGGTGGGDGQGNTTMTTFGRGTGEDLTSYPLQHWVLTPGQVCSLSQEYFSSMPFKGRNWKSHFSKGPEENCSVSIPLE